MKALQVALANLRDATKPIDAADRVILLTYIESLRTDAYRYYYIRDDTRRQYSRKEFDARIDASMAPPVVSFDDYPGLQAEQDKLENSDPQRTCECYACLEGKTIETGFGVSIPVSSTRMILCAVCGNKRCPHANDHRNACTGSNEAGQPGSAYPNPPWKK